MPGQDLQDGGPLVVSRDGIKEDLLDFTFFLQGYCILPIPRRALDSTSLRYRCAQRINHEGWGGIASALGGRTAEGRLGLRSFPSLVSESRTIISFDERGAVQNHSDPTDGIELRIKTKVLR